MERETSLVEAKKIMGNNFIGPNELKSIEERMGIYIPDEVLKNPPLIHFDEDILEKLKHDYILVLGIPYYKDKTPLTIVKMREHFGWDPEKSEPCFYNQDWYLNEKFATKISLEQKWYLIKKVVYDNYRGVEPQNIEKKLNLPSAILCAFTFFAFYFVSGKSILWENDFIWCEDHDTNGDRIYVGRYKDILSLNKNGFNIHRHLKIKDNYSFIRIIE